MSDRKFPKVIYVQESELPKKTGPDDEDDGFFSYEHLEKTADPNSEVAVAVYELKEIVTVVNKTEIVRAKK
jgi:hypothetical protein